MDDDNLRRLFGELKPEQRLVNILFDEVKLVGGTRFSGGHVLGYATNNPAETDPIETAALAIEIVCHHGGPRYVLRVHPVAKLNATEQYQMLLDAISVIKKNGGVIISLISDNAPTNVKTFKLMGGPGKVVFSL